MQAVRFNMEMSKEGTEIHEKPLKAVSYGGQQTVFESKCEREVWEENY